MAAVSRQHPKHACEAAPKTCATPRLTQLSLPLHHHAAALVYLRAQEDHRPSVQCLVYEFLLCHRCQPQRKPRPSLRHQLQAPALQQPLPRPVSGTQRVPHACCSICCARHTTCYRLQLVCALALSWHVCVCGCNMWCVFFLPIWASYTLHYNMGVVHTTLQYGRRTHYTTVIWASYTLHYSNMGVVHTTLHYSSTENILPGLPPFLFGVATCRVTHAVCVCVSTLPCRRQDTHTVTATARPRGATWARSLLGNTSSTTAVPTSASTARRSWNGSSTSTMEALLASAIRTLLASTLMTTGAT